MRPASRGPLRAVRAPFVAALLAGVSAAPGSAFLLAPCPAPGTGEGAAKKTGASTAFSDGFERARGAPAGWKIEVVAGADAKGKTSEAGEGLAVWLIETYGLAPFQKLYPLENPSDEAKKILRKSFPEMERDWHEFLKKYR